MRHAAIVGAGLVALGSAVLAGPAAVPEATAAGVVNAQLAAFSEGQLRSFAAVAVRIFEIQKEFRARIVGTPSESEQNDLRAEGLASIIAVIEDQGMTRESFNEIVEAARADPGLADQIGAYIDELQ